MTVRVNKSAFNIRERLSELERPIGVKGNELMRAETAQEARDLVSAGRKNLIINGDMRIAQRGTSGQKASNGYGGYLSVDRWGVYYQHTTIAQTDVTINGQPKKACRLTASSSNGRAYAYQKIENSSRLLGDGTPFSVSFWARASRTEQRRVNWRYYDNGNENNPSNTDIDVITIETEWKHYKLENISIVDANYNGTRDGGLWLFNNLGDEIGSGFWFEFTEVQVELGKNATDFEHRSYGEELALCQRYYQRLDGTQLSGTAGNDRGIFHGHMWGTTNPYWIHHFSSSMRTGPSLELSSGFGGTWYSGGSTGNYSNMNLQHANEDRAELSGSISSGLGSGNSAWFRLATANDFVAFNAEL